MKIEKLTPEQEALIPVVRDEFLRHGLSTEPADFDAAEQAIKDAYAVANLPAPKLFIRLASPHEGAIGAAILKNTRLGENVGAQVGDQVWDQVWDQVRAQVRDQVGDQVWDQVGAQVWAQVWDQVWDQVGAQVRAQVWDQVGAQVGDQVGDQVSQAFYSQHEAGWLSWLAFFRRVCDLPNTEKIEPLLRIAQSCGWVWFFAGAVIMTDRPRTLKRDEQNRLHCETGPAIEYRDGFGISAWHGTRVPHHWISDRANLDPKEVIKASNVEQRAAGAAIIGWTKMLTVLKAKTVDKHANPDIGELIELTLPGLPEPGRFLKAVCPRNGIIVEGVPRVSDIDGLPINTALAAQAWRIGDPQSEYIHPERRT
ncbi:hypothetical protein G6K93_07525 [Agrobacterium rhizogenes]|nr:hypothetical protein [Rhizobium rhizogenes]